MLKQISAGCFLMFCATVVAQHSISGQVQDQRHAPLVGAQIRVSQKTSTTDATGHYALIGIAAGPVAISVSYIGYKSIDTIVTVHDDRHIDFRLRPTVSELKEVTITQKTNTVNTSVLEQKIKTETIEKYSNQTLGDALREVAGVSSLKTGSTVVKPIINGLYGSRVPVISNNVRLEDQEWGTEHAPNFDINAAGKITVIKGASGLQYGGDAVGGLVIIEPVSIKTDTLFGKSIANYSSNGRGGTFSSSLHKGNEEGWSWNALGTFKYLGDRESADYVLSNSGNREKNFSGNVKYERKKFNLELFYSYYDAEIGILSASHIGNATDLFNAIDRHIPYVVRPFTYDLRNPKQDVKHHLAKLNSNYQVYGGELALQYAFQYNRRLEFDVRRGNYNDKPALDLELVTHSINADYKKTFVDWSIKSGTNFSYQSNFANPQTGISPLIPTYEKFDAGLYAVLNYDISSSMTFESGLRYDFSTIQATKFYKKSRWDERNYNDGFSQFIVNEVDNQWLTKPEFTYHNLSASLGFHKHFEKNLDWFTNLSLAARNPNPSELFSDGLHHSTSQIELGELNLDKEQSFKATISIQKKWRGFSAEVTPFINYIKNYIFLAPLRFETTIRGTFPVWDYGKTNARLMGIDAQAQWEISKYFSHSFDLAYVNGEDVSKSQPLIDMPPLSVNNKIIFQKKEWYGLTLELKSNVVFFQSRYPNNDFTTNIVVDGELTPVLVKISRPTPAYALWDFYSEMELGLFGRAKATVAFSIQNILNEDYRNYLNRQRFFAQETGRNLQLQLKINY